MKSSNHEESKLPHDRNVFGYQDSKSTSRHLSHSRTFEEGVNTKDKLTRRSLSKSDDDAAGEVGKDEAKKGEKNIKPLPLARCHTKIEYNPKNMVPEKNGTSTVMGEG